jgi:hypothetical protein
MTRIDELREGDAVKLPGDPEEYRVRRVLLIPKPGEVGDGDYYSVELVRHCFGLGTDGITRTMAYLTDEEEAQKRSRATACRG